MIAAVSLLIATLYVLVGFEVPAKVVTIGAVGFFVYAIIALIVWLVGKNKQSP